MNFFTPLVRGGSNLFDHAFYGLTIVTLVRNVPLRHLLKCIKSTFLLSGKRPSLSAFPVTVSVPAALINAWIAHKQLRHSCRMAFPMPPPVSFRQARPPILVGRHPSFSVIRLHWSSNWCTAHQLAFRISRWTEMTLSHLAISLCLLQIFGITAATGSPLL